MKVKVKLFAAAREAARRDEVELEMPDGAVARDVMTKLSTRMDPLGPVALRSRLSVNQQMASDETPIKEGDEVALIPPVGGG